MATTSTADFNERIVPISEFHGVDQSRGIHNPDIATSPDEENFVSRFGFLRTHHGVSSIYPPLPTPCTGMAQTFFRDSENALDKSYLLAYGQTSGGGRMYALKDGAWQELVRGVQSSDWHGVNYRHNADDWYIMTNGVNALRYWDGTSSSLLALNPKQGGETIIFSHLTLLYERLWGAVRASEPDRIYWSNSFAPNDWELNYETPDAGGGFLDVATFDGTHIRAIVAAFDDILIFKDKSMHRLNGTYPGEFNLTQVYGTEGTLGYGTIVHTADRLYFLSADGLCVYDGMTVSSLAHAGDRKLLDVWRRLNTAAIDKARACIYEDVIYLSVPLDSAAANSHVIEYNLRDGTYSIMSFAGITDWLVHREGQTETLLCLVGSQIYRYDTGTNFCGQPINAYWTSPEISLGTLTTKKKVGRIYMSVNAQSLDFQRDPSIRITLMSGNKTRSKEIPLKNGHNDVRKRIKVRGRSFRFRIENCNGDPLTINRGMEIVLEEDSDL